MTDTVAIVIPRPQVKEGSAFTATAYFRTAGEGVVPTNAYYRIDNLTACTVVKDWTSITAAASISVPVTSTHNAMVSQAHRTERLQLTVDADHGLSTQVRDSAQWEVSNVLGF
jgi:hypothetical protein